MAYQSCEISQTGALMEENEYLWDLCSRSLLALIVSANQEDTGTNAGDRHVPTIIAISLNFLALIHVVQFVVLVGIIITLAEFSIKYSEEKFKKCFIFFKLMQIIFELEENKMKKKLNQKKKVPQKPINKTKQRNPETNISKQKYIFIRQCHDGQMQCKIL